MRLLSETAKFINFAVLFFFFSISSAKADSNSCMLDFQNMQQRFYYSSFEMNLSNATGQTYASYSLVHRYKNNSSINIWKNLNGEVAGYALKNLAGYDFNNDRNLVSPLSWHETLIFDRIFDKNSKLDGYACVVAGRTRLQGRKVTILRLAPKDDLRYSYFVGKDDESSLPTELAVVTPDGLTALRLSVTSLKLDSIPETLPEDAIFERFSVASDNTGAEQKIEPWQALNIPKSYRLTEEGRQALPSGDLADFQVYSDGITDFRVYRSPKMSVTIPAVRNGTLSLLRRNSASYEYAVIGEIPHAIAETVLSKINPKNR